LPSSYANWREVRFLDAIAVQSRILSPFQLFKNFCRVTAQPPRTDQHVTAWEHHSGNASHRGASGRLPASRFKFETARRQSQLKWHEQTRAKGRTVAKWHREAFFGPLQFCGREGSAWGCGCLGKQFPKVITPRIRRFKDFGHEWNNGSPTASRRSESPAFCNNLRPPSPLGDRHFSVVCRWIDPLRSRFLGRNGPARTDFVVIDSGWVWWGS
jgi:hypothetical protein